MIKDTERVAELENENALLKRELLHVREPWRRSLHASDGELERLVAICRAVLPGLVPKDLDFESFRVCFAALSTQALGRTVEPDHRHYVSHWSNLAHAWARTNNASVDILPATLVLAAVCHGDVPYVLAEPTSGTVGAMALAEYAGKPASHRWRAILSGSARLLPPTPPRPSRMAPMPSQVLIVGGDRARGVGAGPVW